MTRHVPRPKRLLWRCVLCLVFGASCVFIFPRSSGSAIPRPARKKVLEPFAFEVDVSDHCETPGVAYKHIAFLLREIAQEKFQEPWRIASKKIQIYDPYYCQGGVKTRLLRLGFERVHNENQDFYKVCEAGQVPPFDVLLTNPPFSADEHFSFALDFAIKSGKPWLMILPVHVIFRNLFVNPTQDLPWRPFVVAPQKKYNFKTPAPLPPPPTENRAKARSRSRLTHTLWVVHGGENQALHQRLLEVAQKKVSDLCHVATNVLELPKVALPGEWTEEMRQNAEREGLELP